MENEFSRTEMLIGKDNVNKLKDKTILIFGVGGVGSYVTEALARSGIGNFILVDNDVVSITNINRQIIALHSTIGKPKVDVCKSRILDINPNANIICHQTFVTPDNVKSFFDYKIDYVVDAIDNISAKLSIIELSKKLDIPIVSSMGTGNKLDPSRFKIVDISKTSVCPLAKVMRKELKNRNIKNVKVLFSDEEPIKNNLNNVPASISFVPSVAGLMIAGYIIKDMLL